MTAPPSQHDELFEKWREWLALVHDQVVGMFHNRQIWREMRAALEAKDGRVFLITTQAWYVDGQAIAVRRIADPKAGHREISLGRLLADISKNCGVMSRSRFVGLHSDGIPQEIAIKTYDELFGDGGTDMSMDKLEQTIARLEEASRSIREFADRFVAHTDNRGMEALPTFDDLDRAIDEIGRVLQDVTLLLEAASLATVEPAIQVDWKHPFRGPLFTR